MAEPPTTPPVSGHHIYLTRPTKWWIHLNTYLRTLCDRTPEPVPCSFGALVGRDKAQGGAQEGLGPPDVTVSDGAEAWNIL